jgi:hypothetical protein
MAQIPQPGPQAAHAAAARLERLAGEAPWPGAVPAALRDELQEAMDDACGIVAFLEADRRRGGDPLELGRICRAIAALRVAMARAPGGLVEPRLHGFVLGRD